MINSSELQYLKGQLKNELEFYNRLIAILENDLLINAMNKRVGKIAQDVAINKRFVEKKLKEIKELEEND